MISMIGDWLIYGLFMWGVAALVNTAAFSKQPASKRMAWTLTVGIFFFNLVGLSLLQLFQYKLFSQNIGIQIRPKNALDFVGAFLFSQLFFVLLRKVAKSDAPTYQKELIPAASKQTSSASSAETIATERVMTTPTRCLNGIEDVPKLQAMQDANAPTPSEARWAAALVEFESDARRPGLWAKTFAEANGNEAVAQAAYLRYRSVELEVEEQSKIANLRHAEKLREVEHEKQIAEAEVRKREAELPEAERAYAALAKGLCPNGYCKAVIPLISQACPKCTAIFGGDGWKVIPLK